MELGKCGSMHFLCMSPLNHLQGPIVPPEKLVSPVAEALRQVLSRFSWALQGGALLPPPAPPTMPDEDEGDTSFGPPLTSTPYSTPDRSMHQRPIADGGPPHTVGRDCTDAANSVGDHLQGDYRCESEEWGASLCNRYSSTGSGGQVCMYMRVLCVP